jgi:hypothetical protein
MYYTMDYTVYNTVRSFKCEYPLRLLKLWKLGTHSFLMVYRIKCCLKMRFLLCRETHVSRERSFVWAHFLHFGGLKCDFCRVVKPTVQGDQASCELVFCILAAWKCDFCRVVKPTFHAFPHSCELIFCILASWKYDFYRFVKPTLQGYLASCELIFCILVAWKCDFFRVLKPTAQG